MCPALDAPRREISTSPAVDPRIAAIGDPAAPRSFPVRVLPPASAPGQRGAWAAFQFLVRRRLLEEGASVAPDGSVS